MAGDSVFMMVNKEDISQKVSTEIRLNLEKKLKSWKNILDVVRMIKTL